MSKVITDIESRTISGNEYLEGLTDKTILIAGAGGYLGTALLSSLYSIRCHVVTLVRDLKRATAPRETKAVFQARYADLSQSSVWLEVLRDSKPDVIVNLAAHEHRRNSPHSPALDLAVNTATVLELLETCAELDIKPRIVLANSANIAGCPRSPVVNEDTPDLPLTLDAVHKLAAEQYLSYYAHTFNIPAVSLRLANVYGPLRTRDTEVESRVVLNNIMHRALAGAPLYLYRNHNCVRDFVYIDDVIRAISAAVTSETIIPGSKYIVGSGEGYTLKKIVNEIAKQVETLCGQRVEVRLDEEAPLEPIEWRDFIADYTLLRSATGWGPRTKLRQGIELTLQAFSGGHSH